MVPRADVESGPVARTGGRTARALLAEPQDVVVLHGDIHHGNVLTAPGAAGSPSIRRACTASARSTTRTSCNPDRATATAPGRLARRLDTVSEAHTSIGTSAEVGGGLRGLSAAWSLEDGEDAALALTVMRLASERFMSS